MSLKTTISAVLLFLASVTAFAQDVNGDGAVTYLIPISVATATPGAHGTLWQSQLWIHNYSTLPIFITNCGSVSPGCGGADPHPPLSTEQATVGETASSNAARVFELPVDIGVGLSSRLFELSRHTQPAGVEMPVVTEVEFLSRSTLFLAVPRSAAERVALRIYDPDVRVDNVSVRVDIIANQNPVRTTTVILSKRSQSEPGYALVSDVLSELPEDQRYDIRVTPLVSGIRYWALVSVTDNETQQVLLISPQAE